MNVQNTNKNSYGKIAWALLKEHRTTILVCVSIITIKLLLAVWCIHNFDFTKDSSITWISIWDHWDSNVYKTIAQTSYNYKDIALDYWAFLSHFPPLYSIFINIFSKIFSFSLPFSGLLISWISGIISSIIMYKLAYLEFKSEKIAWLSVIFFNLYPTSYFTISVYSEALFICFAISSLYFLKKEMFLFSGITAMCAFLTRFVGIVFLPIYGVYFLYNLFKHKRNQFSIKTIYPFLFTLIGLLIYLIINQYFYGSSFYFLTEKISFNNTKHLILPFQETFFDLIGIFKSSNLSDQTYMVHQG